MMRNKPIDSFTRPLLASAAALALVANAALAVTPKQFSQTTEADFADGDAYGTVVTNLGDIKLSSDTLPIDGLPDDIGIIYDVAPYKGGYVVACGPAGKLVYVKEGQTNVIAELSGEQVFALHSDVGSNHLYIGVSGQTARVLVVTQNDLPEPGELIDLDALAFVFEFEGEQYIYDLDSPKGHMAGKPRSLFVATGPNGRVYHLKFTQAKPEPKLILDAPQPSIRSIAAHHSGNVYAGTDTDGLVYRIKTSLLHEDYEPESFVVYDAPEAEIAALAIAGDGMVYAGTAATDQAKPGRLEQPIKEESGRSDVEVPELDIENRPPAPEELDGVRADLEEAVEDLEDAFDEALDADQGDDQPVDEPQDAEPGKPVQPTPEQYDALREALKAKLEEARETGAFGDIDAAPAPAANNNAQPSRPSRAKPATPARKKQGNAIYRIAPDGFVTEVFRESAMILAIVSHNDKLVVATGNEGQVFSVNPALRETTVLADLDSAQVTCATPTDQGLLLGGANPGVLMRMNTAVAEQGGYTSRVLDAGQVSIFGTFKLTADIPEGTTVAVELRSGNVGDPEQGGWSNWTPAKLIEHDADANPLQPRELKLDAPPARYLQYRLTLTGDGKATPIIDQADLAYVAPNTPPTVAKLLVNTPKPGAPGTNANPKYTIQWQATDDNADRLVFSLEYKPGKADKYFTLAEDLTGNKYEWQTQHVPDGWYTLRLTAHDKLDNPPTSAKSGGRVSEPVLIDNTAPTLEGLKAQALGGGKVKLTAKVADELSAIASVGYALNGSDTYQASLPDDLIYDSTSEPWGVTIPDLSAGQHVIAIRAIDARGNTAYRQLIVEVE